MSLRNSARTRLLAEVRLLLALWPLLRAHVPFVLRSTLLASPSVASTRLPGDSPRDHGIVDISSMVDMSSQKVNPPTSPTRRLFSFSCSGNRLEESKSSEFQWRGVCT